MVRHKDPRVCGVSSLAFYFFSRFMVNQEPFPDFTTNLHWFSVKAFKSRSGGRPTALMKYQTHRDFIAKVCTLPFY
jgi:hypothetical protein